MSMRDAEIKSIFELWLERYSPPRDMRENAKACQAEADALLRMFTKFAPHSGVAPWCREALDLLDEQMKTRAWPTVNELGAVCRNLTRDKARSMQGAAGDEPRSDVEIIADKMNAGQAVGVGWIWGRGAVELAASRLVSEAVMTRYRSGLFFGDRDAYGDDFARRKEAERKQGHEEAKAVFRDKDVRTARSPVIPEKASPARELVA